MRRKLNMDVEKEKKIDYKKLGMYLFDLPVTQHFQLFIKNYYFPQLTFLLSFRYIRVFSFPRLFYQFSDADLTWPIEKKNQFLNQASLIIFENFNGF